ncbi:MAG: DUF1700 domain-containing protein [Blautia sp.]|nr:DUF1700 domain-containing protein [Blautia sp.]
MNKEQFLSELRRRLSGLPSDEIEERIAFYSEVIDDRMEEGLTEEEAISCIGPVDAVVEQIMTEIPLTTLVKDKIKPKRKRKGWEVALLILGSPVWLPILIAFAAVVFAVFVAFWAVGVSLYAADLGLWAGTVGSVVVIGTYLKTGNLMGVLFTAGAAIACAGLAILLFIFSKWITRCILRLTERILLGIKSSFVGKEA